MSSSRLISIRVALEMISIHIGISINISVLECCFVIFLFLLYQITHNHLTFERQMRKQISAKCESMMYKREQQKMDNFARKNVYLPKTNKMVMQIHLSMENFLEKNRNVLFYHHHWWYHSGFITFRWISFIVVYLKINATVSACTSYTSSDIHSKNRSKCKYTDWFLGTQCCWNVKWPPLYLRICTKRSAR